MKRKIFRVLFALVLMVSLGLVTAVPAAATGETIVLGGDVATAIGAQASDEYYTGTGCWRSALGTKMELYIDPTVAPFDSLGTFTIAQIASISYWTNKPGSEGDVDFYLAIYTAPNTNDDTTDWYGYRLNAEPYFSQDLNAPANQWNTWSTDDGTNQLTFFDTAKTGGYGSYNQPTLQDLQAGTINWSTYNSNYTNQDIDYGVESVKYITFQTGTGWMDTFDGYIDAITIGLTTGASLTIDLEQFYNEVWVDDDAAAEWYVPSHFANIQDGIDAVAEGGTINVAAGMYNENLQIEKALTVRSIDGAEQTIIDGTGSYIVTICHSFVTFDGFTVTNPDYAGGADASGILVHTVTESVNNVQILNNIVTQVRSETGTPSTYGATGINIGYATTKGFTLSDVLISGNTITNIKNPEGGASDHTCGINVWDGGENIEISNNTISDIKYNGIILEYASNVQIENNPITRCETGIRVEPYEGVTVSNLTVNLNNFADNSSIQVFDGAGVLVIEDVLANNTFDRAVTVDSLGFSLLHTIWSSIQDAIDAALSGDTIKVAAGTYPENITIDRTLTLEGAQAGVNARGRTGPESIINAQEAQFAVLINGAETVATFDGFTVDNYDTVGILGGAFSEVLEGVTLGEDPLEVHILNNVVKPPTIEAPHNNNIQVGDGTTGTIIGNEVSGAFLESGDWSGSGIIVAGSSNVEVSNNHADDCEGGIQILGYAEYRGGPAAVSNLIENNLVENCDAGISVQGNSIGTIIRHNDVLNNDVGIESMAYDSSWDHSTPSGTEVHYNNIVGNTDYGVQSVVYGSNTGLVPAEEVNATKNWWGTKAKDLIKKMVSDNVDYVPWLDAAYDMGESFAPVSNITRGTMFSSIQAAIDDTATVAGDTISVAAETYNEQVVIDKQLTLNGANADVNAVTGTRGSESIIDGGTETAITISADDVIVDGFTLDGGITLDDAVNPISGGTISNNIITGADNAAEPIKPQNGIRVGWDYGVGVDGVTIEDNTIINSLEKGIRFSNTKLGDGGPQHISNITISGNEIKDNGSAGIETYGPGPNRIINNIISGNAGNGINLKFGRGDVVTGNTITNNTGPGITLRQATDTTVENNSVSGHVSEEVIKTCDTVIGGKGSGIHIFDTSEDNTIRCNDISDNNYGIFIHSKGDLQPSGNSINFNNISGNTFYGILNALVDPPAPVDATNNWWGTTTDDEVAAMVSANVAYDPWHLKQITDLTVSNPTEGSVDLFWTTAGAWDGDYFDVRYSTSPITAENWSSARRVTGEPTPATTVNTPQGMRVNRLSGNTTYHFGLKLTDRDIGSSDISNIVSATTLTTAPTDTTPPSAITDLEAATGTPPTKKVILSWTAKGDDETVDIASKYIIKQSTSEITAANFDSATTVHNNLRCKSNGESESFTVSRLTSNTGYYFAIKIQDEVPNTSAISNVVNTTTANLLPTITNISPTTADNGGVRTLTITGTNFTSSGTTVMRLISDDNTFHLPNVTYVSATQLTAVVPIGAPTGTYKARVINNNGRSALSSATYIVTAAPTPLPVVTNLIPQMAASNTAVSGVKIFGKNLTGATAVRFGDTAATSFTVISDTKITADVPGLTVGEYDVKVTTPAGTNSISAVKFKVSAPVVFNTATTEDTTTSEVIDLGDTNVIPVQITLTTDTSETATQATDTDAEIEVVIPPQTTVTDSEGNDYTGNINPPRVVKPDESVLTDLADNAVVIEMGNPEKTINFDQDFVMTIIITTDTEPVIWYYNKDTKAYELAGKTGTKDGIDYVPGGTKLNQEDNTYTMGLLLDHMSPYIAGVNPHITSAPATATADVAFTISGTNFHLTGANVYFNGTAGTIISRTSTTQIVVTFPAAGSYTLKVENPDRLSDTTSITLGPYAGVGVGGGGPAPPPPGTTDVRGEVSSEGVFEEPMTAFSEDELCTLTIPEGTVGLTEDLEPLDKITILREDEPPEPPEEADIVLAYDLGPDGATFDPAITLTFSYDPADIPEGKDVLVVAYYDEVAEAWVYLEGVVNPVTKTITVSISHFTTFAVIARAPAAPPPALAPAAFTSSSLTVSPLEVDIGGTVTISVLVANTGEEEGSYTVTLKINGVVEETREITLAGGASETATFTTAEDEAGTYSVGVDGLTGSFTVREIALPPPVVPPEIPPPGVNWAIWGPVIGVAVFLAIFLPIRWWRRRA